MNHFSDEVFLIMDALPWRFGKQLGSITRLTDLLFQGEKLQNKYYFSLWQSCV